MVQIEKRKKKGRPSKSDLQARTAELTAEERDVRRSLRRRSFRYNIIDYDEDYLDDDQDDSVFDDEDEGDDEDEDDARRDKKVKLVVKINCDDSVTRPTRLGRAQARCDSDGDSTRPSRLGRVAPSCDSDGEVRTKKRRINGRAESDDDDDDDDDVEDGDDDVEGRDRKGGRKKDDYNIPGTPGKENDGPTPLPDKKQLELILDKLQKKDTYGVYSEPVDPDELPDYHEVIEHPMDFSTVRKKLADGCYPTFEEFECDVFLISSNAMQYNASDTVYHKQARAIKELAEKKFQRMRVRIERSEPKSEPKSEPQSDAKSEPKEKPCSVIKKQIKKPLWHGMQEPVGLDFSSAPTLVTEDVHNSSGAELVSKHERPSNNDGPIEGVSSLADHSIEKAEDPQSGKGMLPKFAKRLTVVDENRRGTYNKSNLPEERPESLFTTFESDKKQLIPVGLSGEYAYCRSLSRFAANLGPIAWSVASKRIEQFLPPGFKYGRGWIGEFEPLPSAIVYVGQQKDPFISSRLLNQHSFDGKVPKTSCFESSTSPITNVSAPQHHTPLQHTSGIPSNMTPKKVESNCLPSNDHKTSAIFEQHIRVPRNVPCRETTGSQAISDHEKDIIPHRQLHRDVEVVGRSAELCSPLETSKKLNNFSQKQSPGLDISAPMGKSPLQSLPFSQSEGNGHVLDASGNGKMVNNFVDSNRARSMPGTVSSQQLPHRLDQSLNDPVLVMKMLTEKAQRQQNGSVHPHSTSQPKPPLSSPRGDPGGNAAAAAANAWMSVGALGFRPPTQNQSMNRSQMSSDSLYNGTRVFYPQAMQSRADSPVSGTMQFPPEKIGPAFPTFTAHPVKASNEVPMGYPQLATHDLSRFQMQTPWRGLSPHTEQKQKPKQKQDMLPPDLNVAFQSSVDSQQPDLALQL